MEAYNIPEIDEPLHETTELLGIPTRPLELMVEDEAYRQYLLRKKVEAMKRLGQEALFTHEAYEEVA